MKTFMNIKSIPVLLALMLVTLFTGSLVLAAAPQRDLSEVLVYGTKDDGSIMHWLSISPLYYNVAYIGDSMSADTLAVDGQTELTIRPKAGDRVNGQSWKKMHYSGSVVGPSMCELFNVAGYGFDYAITNSYVYIYSPQDRPNALFSGSADDALKVVFNGKKIWSNQIQRSPTYDSDQVAAPLKKGWNTMLCVVDQAIGGHLLCARFLDDGKPVTDLQLSLDPPAENAVRHLADPYNKAADELARAADTQKNEGKLAESQATYDQVLAKYPLADVAPRAAYARAMVYYSVKGDKSLGQPENAIKSLQMLLENYPQDLNAEYALLDLGKIQEVALKDAAKATATYRSFESMYPQSSLAAKSLTELARMQALQKQYDDSIITYRKAIQKYANSDEVMTATVGIADTYRLEGEKDKARKQYETAMAMAKDWHDNKYGIDVGKQAWLRGIMDYIRPQLGPVM